MRLSREHRAEPSPLVFPLFPHALRDPADVTYTSDRLARSWHHRNVKRHAAGEVRLSYLTCTCLIHRLEGGKKKR